MFRWKLIVVFSAEVFHDETNHPFTERTNKYNFALQVEDQTLWAPRDLLACHSDAWEALIYGPYKECNEGRVVLVGKKYNDVLELLLCVVPCPLMKKVDGRLHATINLFTYRINIFYIF